MKLWELRLCIRPDLFIVNGNMVCFKSKVNKGYRVRFTGELILNPKMVYKL